jgi:hypothetical protein
MMNAGRGGPDWDWRPGVVGGLGNRWCCYFVILSGHDSVILQIRAGRRDRMKAGQNGECRTGRARLG